MGAGQLFEIGTVQLFEMAAGPSFEMEVVHLFVMVAGQLFEMRYTFCIFLVQRIDLPCGN